MDVIYVYRVLFIKGFPLKHKAIQHNSDLNAPLPCQFVPANEILDAARGIKLLIDSTLFFNIQSNLKGAAITLYVIRLETLFSPFLKAVDC